MEDRPDDLSDRDLLTALEAWGLGPVTLDYAPVGFGDYHWIATGPAGRWFVTAVDLAAKPPTGLADLRRAMDTAAALHATLRPSAAVVAPLLSRDGSTTVRTGPRHAVTVFPYVDGVAGHFGERLPQARRDALIDLLATLHRTPAPASTPTAPLTLPRRDRLEAALTEALANADAGQEPTPQTRATAPETARTTGSTDEGANAGTDRSAGTGADAGTGTRGATGTGSAAGSGAGVGAGIRGAADPEAGVAVGGVAGAGGGWRGGPYSEPARALVAARADGLRRALERFDRLAREVRGPFVVTHGEPHPGNLLWRDGRPALVDWDTVGLAPPERDLWLAAPEERDLARYEAATGRRPDPSALALYRLRWDLDDVCDFLDWFRAPHGRTPDTEVAWRGLEDALARFSRL
ncbi:phosphotransferase [Nonomuraea sp. NPDC049725]|uniref:phosphotransferase family protein n=1 Tax=Nonomuraea sp. NPDC049725 TaxID=3154508 RepID=UPI003428117E